MSLRVCLVTPFDWSKPSDVNEHVAASAAALEARGHAVTILAPSSRATELTRGRRALRQLARGEAPLPEVVALAPTLPVAPRSRVGVPVAARANLRLALTRQAFDVVHAHEPGIASLSYLALRDARTLTVATFHGPERVGYPPGKAQRARLLTRLDALTAIGNDAAAAARARYPGEYLLLPAGIDLSVFRPGPAARRFALELDAEARPLARQAIRALRTLPGWELVVLRRSPLAPRPYVPRDLRARVSVHRALDAGARAEALRGAAGLVAGAAPQSRLRLDALACGVPVIAPAARLEQPELVAAAMQRLAEDEGFRAREAAAARDAAAADGVEALGEALEALYGRLVRRRRRRPREAEPLAGRPWILADLHVHTDASHDCSIPVPALLDHAERIGLGAIAVTDHNVFGGAARAAELADGRPLRVIRGEEVKTKDEGEVIGLFLSEPIPRGMSLGETIAAIRDQGGLVYLPHPFDRLHAIPDPASLHRHLPEIDVLEAYNARLLLDGFNEEALRFARKYNLLMGAGSDAHVLQGLGTGCLRMRAFDGPEEFLLSLESAEIVRRPKSLLYLQGLKWVAQARDRSGRASRPRTRARR
jgi:predicted metal-dependent phosphoesterase TrpH/glycosyltransferase involved in cell wall biosynthesis